MDPREQHEQEALRVSPEIVMLMKDAVVAAQEEAHRRRILTDRIRTVDTLHKHRRRQLTMVECRLSVIECEGIDEEQDRLLDTRETIRKLRNKYKVMKAGRRSLEHELEKTVPPQIQEQGALADGLGRFLVDAGVLPSTLQQRSANAETDDGFNEDDFALALEIERLLTIRPSKGKGRPEQPETSTRKERLLRYYKQQKALLTKASLSSSIGE